MSVLINEIREEKKEEEEDNKEREKKIKIDDVNFYFIDERESGEKNNDLIFKIRMHILIRMIKVKLPC